VTGKLSWHVDARMMLVVAGTLSPDRQEVIKIWKTKITPCTIGA